MKSMQLFTVNLFWFISCIPGLLSYVVASFFPHFIQNRLSKSTYDENRSSCYLNHFGVPPPITDYSELEPYIERIMNGDENVLTAEKVRLLEPTSGSSGGSKYVPYTAELQKRFQAAISPWIGALFIQYPRLFFRSQYWSISPNTANERVDSTVPIGFDSDAEYLTAAQRAVAETLMAVPGEVRHLHDAETFEFVTLTFLLKARRLGLLSIWHPSFLTIMLDKLDDLYPSLLETLRTGSFPGELHISDDIRSKLERRLGRNDRRAKHLSMIDTSLSGYGSRIWPGLTVVSCWTGGTSAHAVRRIRTIFPRAVIQSKGLIATEGIVSFPIFGRQSAAVLSHVMEFVDQSDDTIIPLWKVKRGKRYSVILTNGGGLYRYRLRDIVEIEKGFGRTPGIRFIAKESSFCDLVGEKLSEEFVSGILSEAVPHTGVNPNFIVIAPLRYPILKQPGPHDQSFPFKNGLDHQTSENSESSRNGNPENSPTPGSSDSESAGFGYVLFVEGSSEIQMPHIRTLATYIEKAFCGRSYHYRHARNHNQLQGLCPVHLPPGAQESYIAALVDLGMKRGDIKLTALCSRYDTAEVLFSLSRDARPGLQ